VNEWILLSFFYLFHFIAAFHSLLDAHLQGWEFIDLNVNLF
jgi:hypothetical protein